MIGQIASIITDIPEVAYVFLCVLLSTHYFFFKCRRDPRLVKFASTIDGSDGLPLLGNSLAFAFRGLGAFGKTCATYSKKYGSIYKLWLGKHLVIGLAEVEYVQIILRSSKTLGKPKHLFRGFEEFWGNALFTAPVPLWRQTRKKLQPIFGRNIMKRRILSINKSIDMFLTFFEDHLNKPEFNLYEYSPYLVAHAFLSSFLGVNLTFEETKYYSFHTILHEYVKNNLLYPEIIDYTMAEESTGFIRAKFTPLDEARDLTRYIYVQSHDFTMALCIRHQNSQRSASTNAATKISPCRKRADKDAFQTLVRPWRQINFLRKLASSKMRSLKKTLREFFKFLEGRASKSEEEDCLEEKRSDNITTSLLTATQGLEKEMKLENYSFDEIMEKIAASTDTTATTLSFCLLMIAMHPEIQKKLNEEISRVFGVDGTPSTAEDLDECKYLDQVVKETLRRFTITPFIFRYNEEDIEVGSKIIPAGVTFMVRIADIHMNPHIYPNPQEFNPDNFSPEAVSQRSKWSFLAFSAGSRDCIGRNFAESMIKLVVITFLRKYKLSTTTKMEEMEYEPGFTVGKRGGYWLSIASRN